MMQCMLSLKMSRTERRMIKTTDGKPTGMGYLSPDFDATKKKYPGIALAVAWPAIGALHNSILPLEFSPNGSQWIHCCGTQPLRWYAGAWQPNGMNK